MSEIHKIQLYVRNIQNTAVCKKYTKYSCMYEIQKKASHSHNMYSINAVAIYLGF